MSHSEFTQKLKGTVPTKIKNTCLLYFVFIYLDCFGVRCLILNICAIEMSAFSLINVKLKGTLLVVLKMKEKKK